MKICVATFYNIAHPGTVLQAYALCRTLTEMGHDAKLIKYPVRDTCPQAPLWTFGGICSRIYGTQKRVNGYAQFVAKHCPETSRGYRTADELRRDPPAADVYICGSDQIWNPKLTGGRPDPAYFLDYGDDAIMRISYAASCGGDTLSDANKDCIKRWLETFDVFSAREQDVAELIRELTGKEAVLVQDPTLLIEDWGTIATPTKPAEGYVLLYQLQKSPQVCAAAKEVAARLGRPLLNIDASPKFWTRPGKDVRPHSPQEWLGLFQNAAAVVTNSFHGTVFSILFHRPFFSIDLSGEKAKRAGRMRTLCVQLGLNGRFVSGNQPLPSIPIDWIEVDKKLEALRISSLEFLTQALECSSVQ